MSKKVASIYPWQSELWSAFVKRERLSRMPHALLFSGPEQTGKLAFAEYLANYMVCRQKSEHPCGLCKDCLLFGARTHPDIISVVPEDKHRQIRIQKIRDIVHFLGCRSNQGGYRVVIICPAEDMNVYAANALLKSLEEPGEKTLIILVSQRPESLLPTIRSRCQQVVFPVPPLSLSLNWLTGELGSEELASSSLSMCQGRPLAALRCVQDNQMEKWQILAQGLSSLFRQEKSLAEISESWKSLELAFVFQWLIQLIASMVRYKMTGDESYLQSFNRNEDVLSVAKQCADVKLLKYHDWLIKHHSQVIGQVNLNPQLFMEALLVRWQNLSLS